ncbi:MAG: NAD-dependent epimerase/dehydratase family protein [Thermoplasmatota archaeon]
MALGELKQPEGTANVLVAGGAGFIGSHIVRRLLEDEKTERVLVIDDLSSGTRENLEGSLGDDRLDVLEMDITDPAVVESAGRDFDLVLHLAAVANPVDYERRPLDTLNVNSDGARNLMSISGRSGSKFIFFSSSEVYGNYNIVPIDPMSETSHSRIILNQRRSPYVVGKCFGEEITISYSKKLGIDHLIIRPFNIYGPNMDLMTEYGRVIPNFCIWGLRGQPLRINGDGTQVRTFCHVDDMVNSLFLLIEKDIKQRSVNVGYPHPTSILDLARMVSGILGIEENFEFADKYQFEPYIRIPDIRLAKDLTGWEPEVDLKTGLVRTIDWFRETGLKKYSRYITL